MPVRAPVAVGVAREALARGVAERALVVLRPVQAVVAPAVVGVAPEVVVPTRVLARAPVAAGVAPEVVVPARLAARAPEGLPLAVRAQAVGPARCPASARCRLRRRP